MLDLKCNFNYRILFYFIISHIYGNVIAMVTYEISFNLILFEILTLSLCILFSL
jgi:hypothetical protein